MGTNPYVNTFTYDACQNRLTKSESGSTVTFTYDAANQLQTSEDISGTTNYTFDADGNQQFLIAPDSSRTTTTWDYENQPTKVELPAGTINTATYNAENLRTEILDSTGTKRFVWDGQQYLLETDETNTTQSVWTNEPGDFTTLISQRRNGASQYPLFDALGSTRELTNSTQTVSDIWIYDGWGNIINRTGTTNLPFQFVGKHGYFTDPDTGANYIIHRVYDPTITRWWSVDPIKFFINPNHYTYIDNNPISAIDPSGLFCQEIPVIKRTRCRCCIKQIIVSLSNISKKGPHKTGTDVFMGKRYPQYGHIFSVTFKMEYFPSKKNEPCALYWGENTNIVPNPNTYNLKKNEWVNAYTSYMPSLDDIIKPQQALGRPGFFPWYYQALKHSDGLANCKKGGTTSSVTLVDPPSMPTVSVTNYFFFNNIDPTKSARRRLAFTISVKSGSKLCGNKIMTTHAMQILTIKNGKIVPKDSSFLIGDRATKSKDFPKNPDEPFNLPYTTLPTTRGTR